MPYEVRQDHAECPEDSPWAVVQIADGELMGCHATEEEAGEQVAALYAAEEGEQRFTGKTAPVRFPTLALEGITTGDGREFAPGALVWPEEIAPGEVTLRWNKEDSHGGEPHTVAVNVGRIDSIQRDGNNISATGVINLETEDGRTAYQMVRDGFLRGVSIDADSISDADIEFVWPEDDTAGEDEDDPLALLFAQPEKMIFHAGRIRGATLVDIPAFAEAYVELLDESGAVVAGGARFAAVASHDTATSEESWDGPENERRLPSPMSLETAQDAYAWIDDARVEDGEIVKDAARFIHHEVGADGSPGAANLTACSTGIGVLNGAREGTTIPDADVQGVYDHLAAHLRDADREPPPLTASASDSLTAASVADDWVPPKSWFENPKLSVYTGVTVHASGRVYGHAAPWGSCHIGFSGECVSVPEEDSHPYFATGEVLTAEGEAVSVGQITVGTGHAGIHLGHQAAVSHYDNTGWAVADVAVGNDEHGIWIAGAIRPNAESARVHELRASGRVSGDWRRIGGKLRLVGLLAVNVAGFLEPAMRARVASGVLYSLVAAGSSPVAPKIPDMTQQQAMRIVMGMLAERVRKE